MANPFMVTPGNQFAPGLQALAGTVGQVGQVMDQRQQREQQQSYMEEGKAALAQAMQSGDPAKVTEVITQYPELSQAAKDAFGITNERTEAIARDTYTRVLSDPTNAKQYIDAGIQQVAAAGGNPINMVQDYAMFEVDPENALKRIQMAAPMFGIGDKPGSVKVQSSQILDDGTSVQVMSDGSTRVISAEGLPLEGEARSKAVKKAQQYGIDISSQKEGERTKSRLEQQLALKPELQERVTRAEEDAKAATGQVKEYFNEVSNVERNIANYQEAIDLIDQGAGTGVIESKLPSMRAASIKLENLRNRLGLDVVGGTTFGALSEAELNMALDTAMPSNLDGPELKQWFQDRMEAQQKYADIINRAIQFLSIPGNTLADLKAMESGQAKQPTTTEEPAAPNPAVKWSDM